MDPSLVLIASYPKSGNTWTRLVLQGLLDQQIAGDVNDIRIGLYGRKRQLFDEVAPAEASSLLLPEIDRLLPEFYTWIARNVEPPVILKTHETIRRTAEGAWVYPPGCVRSVLCLVRHPFDVAASYANHLGYDGEKTVQQMARQEWISSQRSSLVSPFPEYVGSWSENVLSWLQPGVPYAVTLMRYEDMMRDDLAAFRILATAAGMSYTEEQLRHAVESSRFERLQAQEEKSGFREKPAEARRFFRAGGSMSWQGVLAPGLCEQIVRDHGEAMQRLGYLPDGSTTDGLPVAGLLP